jgi:hypothetical protein
VRLGIYLTKAILGYTSLKITTEMSPELSALSITFYRRLENKSEDGDKINLASVGKQVYAFFCRMVKISFYSEQ